MITGVAAEGLNKTHIGKIIDKDFLEHLIKLNKKYQINVIIFELHFIYKIQLPVS